MDSRSEQVVVVSSEQPPAGFSPPLHSANHMGFNVSDTETILTFGQSRVLIDAKTGFPSQDTTVEWLVSLSLSPMALKKLSKELDKLLKTYEEAVGIIPEKSNR